MASAERKNEHPPSVEADRPLLAFETWERYLDSLIDIADLRNLRSLNNARIIASLGYRLVYFLLLGTPLYLCTSLVITYVCSRYS